MKILVTGGSGLVGKHLKDILPDAVYISSKDYDLTDLQQVRDMMFQYKPNIVIHLAARVGGLLDNMTHQVEYLEENVLMNINVLKACYEFNVDRVIGMISTCIYPDVADKYPMVENQLFDGPPTPTNFNYAFAKRCMAAHINSYVNQYNKRWCYLAPCNLYGEYDKFGEHNSHLVSALIKKIYENDKSINMWGSGKPLRQYMYGGDLARVIKHMIDNDIIGNFNVTPSEVYTIKEIVEIGKKACKKENLVVNWDSTKPDGQFRKDVDSSKLMSSIGNFKFISLEEGIKKTYEFKNKEWKKNEPVYR